MFAFRGLHEVVEANNAGHLTCHAGHLTCHRGRELELDCAGRTTTRPAPVHAVVVEAGVERVLGLTYRPAEVDQKAIIFDPCHFEAVGLDGLLDGRDGGGKGTELAGELPGRQVLAVVWRAFVGNRVDERFEG